MVGTSNYLEGYLSEITALRAIEAGALDYLLLCHRFGTRCEAWTKTVGVSRSVHGLTALTLTRKSRRHESRQDQAAETNSSVRPLSPRRPDISVRNIRGVQIESDDDAARIDPSRVAIGGSRGVEARVPAVAQQKRVGDV